MKRYKIICAVLVTCILFVPGIQAFSDKGPAAAYGLGTEERVNLHHGGQYLEEAVLKLVQEGRLAKDKAEKILEFRKKKAEELKKSGRKQLKKQHGKGSLLGDMVREGIITQAEAQLIKEKLLEMKDKRLGDGMQSLVDKGVLTEKDIENMRNYMLKIREERKARIDKLSTMTPEERKEYFKKADKERKDIITRMVEDNIITNSQGEELRKAVPELGRPIRSKF